MFRILLLDFSLTDTQIATKLASNDVKNYPSAQIPTVGPNAVRMYNVGANDAGTNDHLMGYKSRHC